MNNLAVPIWSSSAVSTTLPYRSIDTLAGNPVLVVAAHPDDETLACGGAIALLRSRGCEVRVLMMSDGIAASLCHSENSLSALQAVREQETLRRLAMLGVNPAAVTFLRFQKDTIPTLESPEIHGAIARCRTYLTNTAPQTIFLPWRQNVDPDRQATWSLVRAALFQLQRSLKMVEYPVWDGQTEPPLGKLAALMMGWRLNIESVIEKKQRAMGQAQFTGTGSTTAVKPSEFLSGSLTEVTGAWEVYFEEWT